MTLLQLLAQSALERCESKRASTPFACEHELHTSGAQSAGAVEQQNRRPLAHAGTLSAPGTHARCYRSDELFRRVGVRNPRDLRVDEPQRFRPGEDRRIGDAGWSLAMNDPN